MPKTEDTRTMVTMTAPQGDLETKLRGLIASGVLSEREVADALSRWVYVAIQGGDGQAPELINAGILAAVTQALHETADMGSKVQERGAVRIVAAMRIVAAVLEARPSDINGIWETAAAWEGGSDAEGA